MQNFCLGLLWNLCCTVTRWCKRLCAGAWFVVITGNGEEPWASTDSKALPPPPPPFTSHWQAVRRREVLYENYIKLFLFYTFYVGFGNTDLLPNIYQIYGSNISNSEMQGFQLKVENWIAAGNRSCGDSRKLGQEGILVAGGTNENYHNPPL